MPEPTKDEIIHALETALVEMTSRLEMHRDLIEMLMQERSMYCETRCPAVELEVP